MYSTCYGSLVSIIIPTYNHEDYVAKALDSVFAQTYSEIELIIIDDQSTDRTMAAIVEWASNADTCARFSRLSLLRNERNIGANATINRGIAEARGSIIAVLNSDDMFAETRLEELVWAMADSGAGFAFSKVIAIDESGALIPEIKLPHDLSEALHFADQTILKYPSLGFGFLEKNIAISTGNLVVHKNLFSQVGTFRNLRYVHDWDFALRAVLETEPVYVQNPLYFYRIHSTNSFRSLGAVRDLELDAIFQDFSHRIRFQSVRNNRAPTPENWPYVFDMFVSELYLLRYNAFARDMAAGLNSRLKFNLFVDRVVGQVET